jgi:hypothetical protein
MAACTVAAFLLLVLGGQPRRVTKWAMFWLLGIPVGGGIAWWLWRDAPFNPAMAAAAEPAPHQRGTSPSGVVRAGGGKVFLAAWAIAVGVAFFLVVVISLQGSVNGASDPIEPWSLAGS